MVSLIAGLTILIIGDSHLATPSYLIGSLHDGLLRQGAKSVHTIGVCGSTPAEWLTATPGSCGGAERIGSAKAVVQGKAATTVPISTLIAKEKPDLVVLVFGDTMAAYTQPDFPKTWAWQQTTSLVKAISSTNTKCAWVGPAWGSEGGKYGKTYPRVQLMSKFLEANVPPCQYIDSLKFAKPGQWATMDGQHFTQAGYNAWGAAITQALANAPATKGATGK
ncbi:MAG: SGNH/GDSL hydrolase family protein [Alcaligenaceae bacterium]|nr:SGNH/GDSL hydrolase family protein [Alcaligenaceae bacterium SAGV5]MPS50533.1 SGNH/GDSL hydrolase family protein [Alcaligenaceae bacterium SAGV3]MPT55271.1 SGNH/GDSL hydrolase family protein [Alcaligenaceae bacterium]